VATSGMFRRAFATSRCIVPAYLELLATTQPVAQKYAVIVP